jgi:hypothetical protein
MFALQDPEPEALWPLSLVKTIEQVGSAEAFFVLTLSLPGEDHHLSDTEVSDDALGTIPARVSSWPDNLDLGHPGLEYRLGLPTYVFEIEDPEGLLAEEFAGAEAHGSYRAAAMVRVGTLAHHSVMWPPVVTGIVSDWGTPTRDVLRIVVRPDYDWLRRPLQRNEIRREDWPHADPSAIGRVYPLPFGKFDSTARLVGSTIGTVTGPAPLPSLYVDTRASEWLFLFQQSHAYEVGPNVYLNYAKKVEGVDFDVIRATNAGISYTAVKWLSNPGANPVVTADLTGIEHLGDGTGVPLTTPAAILRRQLVSFAFDGHRNGVFSGSGDALLDLAAFAEADDMAMANRMRPRRGAGRWTTGRRGARYISTQVWGIDVLNETCEAHGWRPYWTEAGKLALSIIDHRGRKTYFEAPHWVREEDLTGETFEQVDAQRRPRDSFETGPVSVLDSNAGWNSLEKLRNRWADQEVAEFALVPYDTTLDDGWAVDGTLTNFHNDAEPHEVIDDQPLGPDDTASRAGWSAGGATGVFRVRCRCSAAPQVPPLGDVLLVAVPWRARQTGTGTQTMKVGLRIGATTYYGATRTLTTDWTDYVDEWAENPATTDPWEQAEIGPDVLQLEVSATRGAGGIPEITQAFLRVSVRSVGPAADLVRERLSRELVLARRPPKVTMVEVGLHCAAIAPGQPVSVSHTAAVVAGLAGWGVETWQRRLHYLLGRRLNIPERSARLWLLDGRDALIPLWETGEASGSAPAAAGVVRLGAWLGGRALSPDGRRFSRPTDDTGTPSGEVTETDPRGTSRTIPADVESYSSSGLRINVRGAGISPDTLSFDWRHGAEPWPIEGGTALFRAIIDTVAGTQTLFRCGSDTLEIKAATGAAIFRRTVNAVDYEATTPVSTYSGTNVSVLLMIRWTPADGGLTRLDADDNLENVPPWTLDIFSGNVGDAGAQAVEGFPGDLYIGSDEGANQIGGHLIEVRVWRQLLTDTEILAEMAARG